PSPSNTYICTFEIGRPIGTRLPDDCSSQRHAVTSIAASVGPYRLYSCTPLRPCRHAFCSRLDSSSPLHTIRRSPTPPVHSDSTLLSSIEGTKCTVVIP